MSAFRSMYLGLILIATGWINFAVTQAAAADTSQYFDVGTTIDGVYLLDPATYAVAQPGPDLEPTAEGWAPITLMDLDRGLSGRHFLIRFSATNTSPEPRSFVFAHDLAFLDTMDVRMVSTTGETRTRTISNSEPFSSRPVSFPGLAYRSTVAPGEVQDFTLRIGMDTTRRMNIGIKLWDSDSFEFYEAIHQLKFSSISIVLGTMSVLWLIFSIIMKQKSFAYYSGYLFFLSLSMFIFYGFAYQFIFPDYPWIQKLGFQGPVLAAMSCALMFSTSYLSLTDHAPWAHRANVSAAALLAIGAVYGIFGGSLQVTVPLLMASLFVPLWLWFCSLLIIRRIRSLSVLLFCAAWGTMGLTAAVLALHIAFKFLPNDWTSTSNYDAITIASLVEVSILTVSVALSIRLLQRERDTANVAATVDPLTGLLNRRGFQQTVDAILQIPAQGRWSLALLDLDHFKVINDTFGHGAGDQVLVDFAELLRDSRQEQDMVCRMGGEEFAILFDASSCTDALAHCERLRARFADNPTIVDDQVIHHRVSIGLASHDCTVAGAISLDLMLRQADEALYRAKRSGRNRVVQSEEDDLPKPDVVLELRLGAKSKEATIEKV
jgi:two-component system, sensor histidine kinase LadS